MTIDDVRVIEWAGCAYFDLDNLCRVNDFIDDPLTPMDEAIEACRIIACEAMGFDDPGVDGLRKWVLDSREEGV